MSSTPVSTFYFRVICVIFLFSEIFVFLRFYLDIPEKAVIDDMTYDPLLLKLLWIFYSFPRLISIHGSTQ